MTMFPWGRILRAIVIGAIVALVILIFGPAIAGAGVPILASIAAQATAYAVAIGLLAALLAFLGS